MGTRIVNLSILCDDAPAQLFQFRTAKAAAKFEASPLPLKSLVKIFICKEEPTVNIKVESHDILFILNPHVWPATEP